MAIRPTADVIAAIENGVTEVTRRIAVYEADSQTVWYADRANDPETNRVVSGNVTIDYNSDERRKLDILLRNDDFAFRLNPRGGFYYDKVIKVFRGVKYSVKQIRPRLALVDWDSTEALKVQHIRIWNTLGFDVDDKVGADYATLLNYDALVATSFGRVTNASATLKNAFLEGRNVVTIGARNVNAQVPHIATSGSTTSQVWGLDPVVTDNPLVGAGITTTTLATATGTPATSLTTWGQRVSVWPAAPSNTHITASFGTNIQGGSWFDLHVPDVSHATTQTLMQAGLIYMTRRFGTERTWETQIGEFLIDGVNDQLFPKQIKLTGRDYTKKLLKDKLTQPSTFVAGTGLRTFVRAIAANGGIIKFRESIGDELFPSDVSYDRGTERWKMIKDACTSFGYEVFFDAEGYLVVRKFLDPTTSPVSHTFLTGTEGNLIDYQRAINDGRIYNVVNVYGDPQDANAGRLPFFGTAVNEDPNSPTSTVKLGRRVTTFASSFFASDAECEALARTLLSISALESYEVNFSSLFYPWLEVGEIIAILVPDRLTHEPTRFLMDSLAMPLDLGPMTGTGKRVTLVGEAG